MAREFSGTGQYLSRTSAVVTAVPFTFACWFRAHRDTAQECLIGVGRNDANVANVSLKLRGDLANDYVNYHVNSGGSFVDVYTTTGFMTNTWYHACALSSAVDSHAVYIDGGSKGTSATSMVPDASMDRTGIGVVLVNATYHLFDGEVAEAAIWNAALTDAEVAVLATGIRPIMVRPQNIVAYWPLVRDQDYDLVGNYNMTPTGSPTISTHPRVLYGLGPQTIPAAAAAAVVNLIAEILAQSATPDDAVFAIGRAMSAEILAGSVAPDDAVLAIARAMAAAVFAGSVAPSDAILAISRALSATMLAGSVTPDDAVLAVARALSAAILAGSVTPDSAILAVTRAMSAAILAGSATADDSVLAVARALSAVILGASVTPDDVVLAGGIVNLIAEILAQSATPDDAILTLAADLISFAAVVSAASVTPDDIGLGRFLGLLYLALSGRRPDIGLSGRGPNVSPSGRRPDIGITSN